MQYISYLFLINTIAFFLFASDKHRACYGKRRIPELVLFASALIGGSFGALMSMLLFRHKTQKPLFRIGVPVLLAVLCVALYLCGYPLNILPDIDVEMLGL